MAALVTEWVLVCRTGLPAGTVGNIVGPASGCTNGLGVRGLPVAMQAYVIDPSADNVIGTPGTIQTPNYPAWNELGSLSIADAQVISGYVGLLWAGVWGIRQVIKSLSIFERNQDE